MKGLTVFVQDPELQKLLVGLTTTSYGKLLKGEKVLISKAISDALAIPKEIVEDFSAYMLTTYKYKVINLLDIISNYHYIDDKDEMYGLVKDFLMWRYRIAYNPPSVMFNSGTDSIIDDLSCLNKYVDQAAMCTLVEVYNNADHLYTTYRAIAKLHFKAE